jgi:hypothetical protein
MIIHSNGVTLNTQWLIEAVLDGETLTVICLRDYEHGTIMRTYTGETAVGLNEQLADWQQYEATTAKTNLKKEQYDLQNWPLTIERAELDIKSTKRYLPD